MQICKVRKPCIKQQTIVVLEVFFSFTSMHGCTLNYQLVVTVVMKNCEPLVSEPAFAIDKSPVHKSQVIFVHISIMIGGNHLFHSEKGKKEKKNWGRAGAGRSCIICLPGPVCFSLKFSSANFSP